MAAASHCQDDDLDIKAETRKFKSVLEKRGIEGLRQEIKDSLDKWNNTKVNVAITGSSGAGKSTLINAILGLDEDSGEAAPTGVTETTITISKYNRKMSNVTFWDLPGIGTPNFPRETYTERANLKDYDFFILISRSRFTENDAWLANQIHSFGKKYYFVRSHVGQDIRNYCKAHPRSADPKTQLEVIRNDCEQHLRDLTQEKIQIYLIDSYMPENYDFNLLAQALVRNTKGVKANLLVASLASATQEIIDMKCRGLFERIRLIAHQAGMKCTLDSAEGEMKKVFDHESKYYREVFEIDDNTLKMDQDLSRLSALDSTMKTNLLEKLSKRFIKSRVKTLSVAIGHYKKKFTSELDELKVNEKNFVAIIFNMLLMYMHCIYQFASSIHQDVPLQYAEMSATQSALQI